MRAVAGICVDETYMKQILPQIDFEAHPAYGALLPKASGFLRAKALLVLMPSLAKELAWQLRAFLRATMGRLKGTPPESALEADFRRHGVLAMDLSAGLRAGIAREVEGPLQVLLARLSKIDPEHASYSDCQLPLNRADSDELYKLFDEGLESSGIFALIRNYVPGAIGAIKALTLQHNRAGEAHWKGQFPDLPVEGLGQSYLHVDTGGGVAKAIYYVSEDVGPDNGPFSYVLGSNTRVRSVLDDLIRSAIDHCNLHRTDRKSREMFYALPKILQRRANFGVDLLGQDLEEVEARELIFTSDRGNLVVFDNYGIHRGGMVENGQRTIIQVVIW